MNDNSRMVPADRLPTMGRVSDDQVKGFSDAAFIRHCIANEIDPKAWKAAIEATAKRWGLRD